MKKFLLIIKEVFLFAWSLPQNILGCLLWCICQCGGAYVHVESGRVVTFWRSTGGVSLGSFIFMNQADSDNTFKHEFGHTLQSRILGPFYLFVIGIPSIMWAWVRRKCRMWDVSYYSFYTEKWADKLGKVSREDNNGVRK